MGIDSVLPDFRGPGGFWKVRALGPTGLLDSGHSLCISERRLSGKLLVGTVPLEDTGQKHAHWPVIAPLQPLRLRLTPSYGTSSNALRNASPIVA